MTTWRDLGLEMATLHIFELPSAFQTRLVLSTCELDDPERIYEVAVRVPGPTRPFHPPVTEGKRDLVLTLVDELLWRSRRLTRRQVEGVRPAPAPVVPV